MESRLELFVLILLTVTLVWLLIERRYTVRKLNKKIEEEGKRVRAFAREVNKLERDSITGILQRSVWESRALSRLRETSLVVCVIDLDGFKAINDKFMHHAGDSILQIFVVALEKNLRRTDILGRYGGDEFLVAFNVTDNLSANNELLLSQIFERVKENFITGTEKYFEEEHGLLQIPLVGFSFGSAFVEKMSTDLTNHIRLADQRMYEQKRKHKSLAES